MVRLSRLAIWILTFTIPATGLAQKPFVIKSHKVMIDGTSTVHDWQSEVQKVEWQGSITVSDGKIQEIMNASVVMQVKSIKSSKGKTMDNKTYDAFKADKNPTITFKSNAVTVNGSQINVKGTLTMAGASKEVELSVKGEVQAGEIRFTGSQKLNMTDYQMDPPKAVMGTIKVAPEVTVTFDLTLKQAP